MERKRLRRTAYAAVFWLFVLAVTLVTATYAWFTFNPFTNVTPMGSTVSQGEAILLIANQENGSFDRECTLILDGTLDELRPLSTADLNRFYASKAQNRNGISMLFSDVSDKVNSSTMHGKVYLKCENGACDVYLRRSGLSLGEDAQTLAALRLGLRISTVSGTHTYILKLDAMGDTASAVAIRTIPTEGNVVAAVDAEGNAAFQQDPSVDISEFFAREEGADDKEPEAGDTALCTLQAGEIAPVEYWLYLEGCDDNCIGEVQKKEIGFQLSFAGVTLE